MCKAEEQTPDLERLPQSVFVSEILPFPARHGFDSTKYLSAISYQALTAEDLGAFEAACGIQEAETGKNAAVVFGPAGVGKSTIMGQLHGSQGHLTELLHLDLLFLDRPLVTIDGDLLRRVRPNFAARQTSLVKERLLSRAIREDKNILIATVRPEDYIQRLTLQGYTVHLLPIFCCQEQAFRRAHSREIETGRHSESAESSRIFKERIHAFFKLSMLATGS